MQANSVSMAQQHLASSFKLTWRELYHWMLGRRRRFNVGGASMQPLLNEDDDVLMRPYKKNEPIKSGDIVIARHPFRENLLIVKQIAIADSTNDRYHLAGLNSEYSSDSESFGRVRSEHIVGKLTAILG